MNLQGEQLELFNQIARLDNESFVKVKKYVKRIIHNRHHVKEERAINYPFARSFNFSLNVGF